MAKFVFTLQPLLQLRQRQEQHAQRALAGVNQHRLQIEQRLRQLQQNITADKSGLRDRLVGSLNTTALRQQAVCTVQGMRTAQQMAVELAGVHKRLFTVREQLTEATRARRAIEILRDRRHEQWKHRQDKADVAAIDELATFAAARQEQP